jgi:uncharacterized protein involved in type VI secretion and phage assembly
MSLYDVLSDSEEERARTRRINGVVVGIITNNHDPEGLGRVKVRFPWLSEDNESDWAKLLSLMAGKERGAFFLPEVDDEVLVAFEHGDINYPYVIGALWNSVDKPPETNADGKNNIRKIRSRSGHEIILNDDHLAKQEKVEIHTNAGHKIVLNDSLGEEKIEIIDKSGSNKVVVDSMQNSIDIESGMQLKIKSQIIEIEAGGMMTIKAGGVLTIQGAMVKIN